MNQSLDMQAISDSLPVPALFEKWLWTEERTGAFRVFLDAGMTSTQIKKMIHAPSRSSMCSKASRLGLKFKSGNLGGPPRSHKNKEPKQRKPAIRKAQSRTEPAVIEIETIWTPSGYAPSHELPPVPTAQHQFTQCSFPLGDPKAVGFGWCAATKRVSSSYCAHHHELCYLKRGQRQPLEIGFTTPKASRYHLGAV